jgi:shikimate dehydrogenase
MDSYLIGLVGTGIGPSLTPALHEREAAERGIPYIYKRLDLDVLGIRPDQLGDLLDNARRLGFDGLNITHPGKQLVLDHVDELSPDAEALGAVNTVVFDGGRAIGHNTDWSGFARSFARGLPDAVLGPVVLIGAGGAGAAVAHAALTLGADELCVVDVDAARADTLAGALRERFGDHRVTAGAHGDLPAHLRRADGVIHATPTGMAAHPGLPLDPADLRPEMWVADVVYRPLETELVTRARALGCPTLDGGGMAVFQAVDAFRVFTGIEPDAERMLRHFATLVGAESSDTVERVR